MDILKTLDGNVGGFCDGTEALLSINRNMNVCARWKISGKEYAT